MPIYIKTGCWEKRKTGYNYALDLDNVISNDPTVKQTSLIIYPLGYSYPDYSTMTGDSVNQTINNYQYVTNIDSYYQFLGSTSYKKLTPEEQALLVHYNEGRKPVHKIYTDATAMYADQKKQHYGWLYRIETDDSHWEYLGTTLGTIADYKPVGGSGGATPSLQAVTDVGNTLTTSIDLTDIATSWTLTKDRILSEGVFFGIDYEDNYFRLFASPTSSTSAGTRLDVSNNSIDINAAGFFVTTSSTLSINTQGGAGFNAIIETGLLTGSRTYNFPDATGTIALISDITGTNSNTNTGDQTLANTSDATTHTLTLSATGGSVQLVEGTGITLATTGTASDGIVTITSTAGGSGLEAIDEGNGVGWRLVGRDAANYGNIGVGAIDLSDSTSASSLKGAMGLGDINFMNSVTFSHVPDGTTKSSRGNFVIGLGVIGAVTNTFTYTSSEGHIHYNFIIGAGNTLSCPGSGAEVVSNFISGNNNTITGSVAAGRYYNAIFGYGNSISQGDTNFVQGAGNIISGLNTSYAQSFGLSNTVSVAKATTFGESNYARATHEFSIGRFGTDYSPASNDTDRIFNIGNGANIGAKANALTILKNGSVLLNGPIGEVLPDASTSRALVLTDANDTVTLANANPVAVTIPAEASINFPINTKITLINLGAGTVTVGITTDALNTGTGGLTLAQYEGRTLIKVASATWILKY